MRTQKTQCLVARTAVRSRDCTFDLDPVVEHAVQLETAVALVKKALAVRQNLGPGPVIMSPALCYDFPTQPFREWPSLPCPTDAPAQPGARPCGQPTAGFVP